MHPKRAVRLVLSIVTKQKKAKPARGMLASNVLFF